MKCLDTDFLEALLRGNPEARGKMKALAALSSRGETVDPRDAMIAAVAASIGLPLVSRSRAHFSRFKELRLEPW